MLTTIATLCVAGPVFGASMCVLIESISQDEVSLFVVSLSTAFSGMAAIVLSIVSLAMS